MPADQPPPVDGGEAWAAAVVVKDGRLSIVGVHPSGRPVRVEVTDFLTVLRFRDDFVAAVAAAAGPIKPRG